MSISAERREASSRYLVGRSRADISSPDRKAYAPVGSLQGFLQAATGPGRDKEASKVSRSKTYVCNALTREEYQPQDSPGTSGPQHNNHYPEHLLPRSAHDARSGCGSDAKRSTLAALQHGCCTKGQGNSWPYFIVYVFPANLLIF